MGVLRFIQGLMWARRESIGGHSPVGGPQMDTGVISIRVAPTATTGAGNQTGMQSIPDNADAQAEKGELLGVIARLQGYDAAGDVWNRLRAVSTDSDAVPTDSAEGTLSVAAAGLLFNGAAYTRARGASQAVLAARSSIGAAVNMIPGQFAASNGPAAATIATVTRAGVPGLSLLCNSITIALACDVNPQPPLHFVLRDGASGVGAILWIGVVSAPASGSRSIELAGLNIVGTPGNAMTLECTAAPVATAYATVAFTGTIAAA